MYLVLNNILHVSLNYILFLPNHLAGKADGGRFQSCKVPSSPGVSEGLSLPPGASLENPKSSL